MKRLLLVLAALLVLGLAAAGAAGWWAWRQVERPYRGFPGAAATVVVEPGTPSVHILDQLAAGGVIADARLARVYMKLALGDPPLQAGEYRFEGAQPLPAVLDKLVRGDVVDHAVTVVEGLTLEETAQALAAAGFGDLDAFLAAMRDPAAIADLDPEAETLEGYLFPSTYRFRRGTTEAEIVETMVGTFRQTWEREIVPLLEEDGQSGSEGEIEGEQIDEGGRLGAAGGGGGEAGGAAAGAAAPDAGDARTGAAPGGDAPAAPAAAPGAATRPSSERPTAGREATRPAAGERAGRASSATGAEPATEPPAAPAPDGWPAPADPAVAAADRPPNEPVADPPRRRPARSVRELVTLASLVEEEAKIEGERPAIAAVYANRLERGMGLYADPTVIYALKKEGRWDGNITRQDLRMDSPYNTYRHAGLPPGPIASPGLASLKAAARPADTTALYFVSRNDGTHVFADTLAEHNRNVDRWQRQYWREQRKRQAAAPRADERQVDRD
jgi:cell division protein YceG involved in septum cleavage